MTDIKLADLSNSLEQSSGTGIRLIKTCFFYRRREIRCRSGRAYWLLDEIAPAQLGEASVRAEGFQVWKLDVETNRATLSCGDGNGAQVYTKQIAFTDFPAPGITLWFTDQVIMLPSEY